MSRTGFRNPDSSQELRRHKKLNASTESSLSSESTIKFKSRKKSVGKEDDGSIISNCMKDPDSCCLCGMGASFVQCMCCEDKAHVRCIRAFLKIPAGDLQAIERWKCPRCVTLDSVLATEEAKKEQLYGNPTLEAKPVPLKGGRKDYYNEKKELRKLEKEKEECIFCQLFDPKKCQCSECLFIRDYLDPSCRCCQELYAANNGSSHSSITMQPDEFTYSDKKLESKPLTQAASKQYKVKKIRKSHWCWSILWVLLLLTFAFPIALIFAPIYIVCYTCEGCCSGCHVLSNGTLKCVRLPGTCVDNTIKGTPMC